jgi:hypothetical protein
MWIINPLSGSKFIRFEPIDRPMLITYHLVIDELLTA